MQLKSPRTSARIRSALGSGLAACLLAGLGVLTPQAGAVAGSGVVPRSNYYAVPVQWAVDHGIIERDDACFALHAPVSRGASVVGLWNMVGQPAAAPHSFSDVTSPTQNDAVAWAVEADITRGTSRTTFSPDSILTRGQFAALLHRLAGRPAAPPHSFTDVLAAWQQAPVSWLASTGITTGTSPATFSPESAVTRAQLVTFLYRYNGEPAVVPDTGDPLCCSTDTGAAQDFDSCVLTAELDRLTRIAEEWDGSARTGISVILSDGATHGVAADRKVSYGSALKPLWTAAAVDTAGLEKIVPLGHATVVDSDNHAAGQVIDLAGGIDAVNGWVREVAGLDSTHLSVWRFGSTRVSELNRGPNHTTMNDLALFYVRLHQGQLLDTAATEQLVDWLRSTRRSRSYIDGVLLDRLPSATAETALHKTGWLPPGWPANDPNLVIDAGVVFLPGGDWFALALSSSRGDRYDRSIRWVGLAACRIYAVVANDTEHDCRRADDPASGLLD